MLACTHVAGEHVCQQFVTFSDAMLFILILKKIPLNSLVLGTSKESYIGLCCHTVYLFKYVTVALHKFKLYLTCNKLQHQPKDLLQPLENVLDLNEPSREKCVSSNEFNIFLHCK